MFRIPGLPNDDVSPVFPDDLPIGQSDVGTGGVEISSGIQHVSDLVILSRDIKSKKAEPFSFRIKVEDRIQEMILIAVDARVIVAGITAQRKVPMALEWCPNPDKTILSTQTRNVYELAPSFFPNIEWH